MNTIEEILHQVQSLGLTLEIRCGKLAVIPASQCPSPLKDAMRQHKKEIMRLLEQGKTTGLTPPGNLALNRTRPDPRKPGARQIMEYIVRQIPETPDDLCAWCLKRELEYWNTEGWDHEECALAAARDAACWQLRLCDDELWKRFNPIPTG